MATPAVAARSRRDLAPTAVHAFTRLADLWHLTGAQQAKLLGLDDTQQSTLYKWKSQPQRANLSHDTLDRISYLTGIYKALHILLPDDTAADSWIHRPNDAPLFAGQAPLERMLSGTMYDLHVVRAYLDAERG
jgi:hypothetical protein